MSNPRRLPPGIEGDNIKSAIAMLVFWMLEQKILRGFDDFCLFALVNGNRRAAIVLMEAIAYLGENEHLAFQGDKVDLAQAAAKIAGEELVFVFGEIGQSQGLNLAAFVLGAGGEHA